MPEDYPKISVVMPTFNQGKYIEESILSIVSQKYPNLEYIIMDGGSTDNTIDIIKKYEPHLKYWTSVKDNGMYDALNKGMQKATGEIMGWLNSDDLLIGKSLFTLADIFKNNPNVDWIQGHPCVVDELGRMVHQRPQRSSRSSFLLKNYHDGIFIQQESTYWRKNLWEKAGSCISQAHKFAGDFELWMRFFKYAELYTTPALIGAFRSRRGQISQENYADYLRECDLIIDGHSKEINREDLAELSRISNSEKSGVFRSLLRLLGFASFPKNKNLNILYDFEKQKFLKSS